MLFCVNGSREAESFDIRLSKVVLVVFLAIHPTKLPPPSLVEEDRERGRRGYPLELHHVIDSDDMTSLADVRAIGLARIYASGRPKHPVHGPFRVTSNDNEVDGLPLHTSWLGTTYERVTHMPR